MEATNLENQENGSKKNAINAVNNMSLINAGLFLYSLSTPFLGAEPFVNSERINNINNQNKAQQKQNHPPYVQDEFSSKKQLDDLIVKAQNGDAIAANSLGLYYDLAMPRNYKKAAYCLRISAQKGHPIAQYNLGYLLMRNKTRESYVEAISWLELAEKNGVSDARDAKETALKWLDGNKKTSDQQVLPGLK